jgi:hypothetical protein
MTSLALILRKRPTDSERVWGRHIDEQAYTSQGRQIIEPYVNSINPPATTYMSGLFELFTATAIAKILLLK